MACSLDELLTNDSFRRFVLNPTQDEDYVWERWISESAFNRELYEEASGIIRDFYEPLSPDEFQSEAIKFKRSIDVTRADKSDIINLYENRRPYRFHKIYRVAAAILLFASALFIINWYFYGSAALDGMVTDASEKIVRKVVGRGQKLTVTFQDGTKVKLNSESTLTYPEEFSPNAREVTLVGEAYFEVAHNEQWPFIVSTKNAQIQVLGTSFNVKAQDNDPDVMVALVDGSVRINSNQQESSPVYLKPLEMAVIDSDHKVAIQDFDLEKITAWKDNKIIFERASFDEVELVLECWFNVTFHYDQKPVFTGGYTGKFVDQSLGNILEGMSTGKFKYIISGNNVYIN